MKVNRRQFAGMLGMVAGERLNAQIGMPGNTSTARPNVAAIERERMVRLGTAGITGKTVTIVDLPGKGSPGGRQDYFSSSGFIDHRDALRDLCLRVGALAGAYGVTRDEKFAAAAMAPLRAWFCTANRMTPHLRYARVLADDPKTGTPEGVIEGVWLAELAVGLPFLAASAAMTDDDLNALKKWFSDYLTWLTATEDSGPRIAALARDRKDHHASSWLLQAAAMARLTADEVALSALRHRFERVALRAQISGYGSFLAEQVTPNPYRDSLMNLDLMAGACEMVSSRFESVWEYELQDGPGMRAAMAYHFPFILNRAKWPLPEDKSHFLDLPLRRPALLFGGRAFTLPPYVDLWKTLPSDPPDARDHAIADSFPIRQPYLWVVKPPFRLR